MYFAFNSLSNSHLSSEKVRTLYYDVYLASLFLNLKKDFRWLNAISLESSGLFNFLALKPWRLYPANIFLHTVNYRNTRKRCEICSKLTIKTSEQRHWRRSGVFLLTLNIFYAFFCRFCCWLWTIKYWVRCCYWTL